MSGTIAKTKYNMQDHQHVLTHVILVTAMQVLLSSPIFFTDEYIMALREKGICPREQLVNPSSCPPELMLLTSVLYCSLHRNREPSYILGHGDTIIKVIS